MNNGSIQQEEFAVNIYALPPETIGGRHMRRKYSLTELKTLKRLDQQHNGITYRTPKSLEKEFFSQTGVKRSHGCLYMASWRLKHGYYDAELGF